MTSQLNQILMKMNLPKDKPYVRIRDPQSGEPITVPNPHYRDPEDDSDDNEPDEVTRSYCSITNSFCPESEECVWWVTVDGEEEDSGCIQVSKIIAEERAAEAQARLFERGMDVLNALLVADVGSSGLGTLVNFAATAMQLHNENLIRKGDVVVPGSVVSDEVEVAHDNSEDDDDGEEFLNSDEVVVNDQASADDSDDDDNDDSEDTIPLGVRIKKPSIEIVEEDDEDEKKVKPQRKSRNKTKQNKSSTKERKRTINKP